MIIVKLLTSLVVTIVLNGVALAGNVYEIVSQDFNSLEIASTEVIVEGQSLKMDIISDGGATGESASIYHADRREMVTLDHDNQEYIIFDAAVLEMIKAQFGGQREENIAAQGQMNSAMKQAYEVAIAALDEQNLTPTERTAAEKIINDTFGMDDLPQAPSSEPIDVISKGGALVGAYPVTVYEVRQGGTLLYEFSVTPWDKLEGGSESQLVFESFFGFFADISEAFDEMGFGGNSLLSFATMSDLEGFPVAGKTFNEGELESEFHLRSASQRRLDPDAFEPPAGYKRRSMLPQ